MSNTINFGIDLGTTNSAIAKYTEGEVEVFKNPINWKQTLPSVVAFKKNRIVIGEKAREILSKNAQNVVGSFKRKMGTSDKFYIPTTDDFISAEQLSAYILKELKNFIHTGESIEAAVITIPASFDTMQSNATKKAGYEAGFEQVVLLQEPIAASLAYANKTKEELTNKKWIVYDLGGGTFDAALVTIKDEEMKVLDHEGNNYLGGTDFDRAIVEKFIIPHLEQEGDFQDLEQSMKSSSGKYSRLYNLLLFKAEEAKITLTSQPTADIEFEIEDDKGEELDIYLSINRAQLNDLLEPYINQTINMIDAMIQRNGLGNDSVDFFLMIGGSTLIPAVREQLERHFQRSINCDIDPTTAVAIGAAFFAGIKPRRLTKKQASSDEHKIKVLLAFDKVAQEDSVPLIGRIEGESTGKYYRITRRDGGFDSGLKPLNEGIRAYLPLVHGVYNAFSFNLFDDQNNRIPADIPEIGITHGKFSIDGQPLPHDICLEVDAIGRKTTFLEPIFKKGTILPAQKTIVREISRNIYKGSDETILINILEGPLDNLPAANKTIGHIAIAGKDLSRDLIKGSDVELSFEISESRDLSVQVYLTLSDQEFENVFNPSETHISLLTLAEELTAIKNNLQKKLYEAEQKEDFSLAARISKIIEEIRQVQDKLKKLKDDDVTDEKYQLDEQKRLIALQAHQLFRGGILNQYIEEYYEAKKNLQAYLLVGESTPEDRKSFESAIANERDILSSGSASAIKMKISQLQGITQRIANRTQFTNDDLVAVFSNIRRHPFKDVQTAQTLIRKGESALEKENYAILTDVVNELYRLKETEKHQGPDAFNKSGTGLQ
jgi:molecular chaperone DnaK